MNYNDNIVKDVCNSVVQDLYKNIRLTLRRSKSFAVENHTYDVCYMEYFTKDISILFFIKEITVLNISQYTKRV